MKIVLISPHRDDVAFSLSLAVQTWLDHGYQIVVLCCFTRSAYAPFGYVSGEKSTRQITAISDLRANEDKVWSESFGVSGTTSSRTSPLKISPEKASVAQFGIEFINLNLEDAPLRLDCKDSDVCGFPVPSPDPAGLSIYSTLITMSLDALVIPLALGGHVDHVTARDAAVRAALKERIPTAFYEDLPYAARHGAASEIASAAAAQPFHLKPRFVHPPGNVREAIERKLSLSLGYKSQVEEVTAREIADFCSHYGGRERIWMTREWRDAFLAGDPLSGRERSI